jgi:hypothetical protein
MPAVALTDLQRQIAERERELQALRQELESRQDHLTELTRRKEDLQCQLQQIEEEIIALASETSTETKRTPTAAPVTPSTPEPTVSGRAQPRMGELIVAMLRDSGEPRTARQLCEEAQRRGYQSISRDLLKAMENRLQVLKSKGIVRRAESRNGFLLASANNGAKTTKGKAPQPAQTRTPKTPTKPAKSEPAAQTSSGKGSSATGAAKTAKPARRGGQAPLREVLTDILKKSRKPLSGSELAELALAAGYQTTSEKFVDSVWSALGQMDNVEHLPQKGYRLKKK